MKYISFKVAVAIKEAGYPQDELKNPDTHWFYDEKTKCDILRPTYIDVWLWLWRKKNISIELAQHIKCIVADIWDNKENFLDPISLFQIDHKHNIQDPEDIIIKAIEILVEHNLIR